MNSGRPSLALIIDRLTVLIGLATIKPRGWDYNRTGRRGLTLISYLSDVYSCLGYLFPVRFDPSLPPPFLALNAVNRSASRLEVQNFLQDKPEPGTATRKDLVGHF